MFLSKCAPIAKLHYGEAINRGELQLTVDHEELVEALKGFYLIFSIKEKENNKKKRDCFI